MNRNNHDARKDYVYRRVESPVGRLTLVGGDGGLAGVLWENDRPGRVRLDSRTEDATHPVLVETGRQLDEYFAGQRTQFALDLDLAGTAFQQNVWSALRSIPFGETRTYEEIARQIGRSGAARAVGGAVARNPVSIVAPCHRVTGADGTLTGFAGGLEVKARLLRLEGGRIGPATIPAGPPSKLSIGERSGNFRDFLRWEPITP